MISINSAASSQLANMRQSMFSRIDTNSDGTVSKEEFVLARPKEVSAEQASTLYDKIDTGDTGALTEEQLAQGMQANAPAKKKEAGFGGDLAAQIQALLIQLTRQDNQTDNAAGSANEASDMFKQMDTDGDGKATMDEFVAARPPDVSADQATALYKSIDTNGTGSITEAQLEESMQNRPAGSAATSSTGGGQPSASEIFDQMDTNKDGVVSVAEFLAAHPKDVSEEQATALYNSIDTKGTGSITEAQLEESMQNRPTDPPPPPALSSDNSTTSSTDNSLKNDQLLFRLLQALQAYAYNNSITDNGDTTTSSLSTMV